MNQCLACNKLSATKNLFCDECSDKLLARFQQNGKVEQPVAGSSQAAHAGGAWQEQGIFPDPLSLPQKTGVEDQEDTKFRFQVPTSPVTEQENDLSYLLPDLWPELESDDLDDMHEEPSDALSDQHDPLSARQLPPSDNSGVGQGAENNFTSGAPEQFIMQPVSAPQFQSSNNVFTRKRALRITLISLAGMIVLALIADIVLASMNVVHHAAHSTGTSIPLLTISPDIAYPGQVVLLHINHFPALSNVFLTHDVQEAVRTDTTSSLVQVGPTGSIEVHILVEDTWGAGVHTVEAEDVTTHYTASTMLQITGAGQIQPPRLAISQVAFNMGSALQGANTIQPLTLRNLGGSAISWLAGSNQPWLFTSPAQGVFSDSQSIDIAVTRAGLSPGTYKGTLSLQSNAGGLVHIQVTMMVLPFAKQKDTILTAIAPALSFMAVDGNASPANQVVTVSNPGVQPLYWNTTSNPPSVPFNQAMSYIPDVNWLQTEPASGTIAPGASMQVHVIVHSSTLLPGAYNLRLHFSYSHNALNAIAPFQPVAVSLTVQPRCGVVASMGVMSFSIVAGANNSITQALSLSTTSDCTGVLDWQATILANWLTMTPAQGQIQDDASTVATVGIRGNALQPGSYTSFIVFVAGQRTQTVLVQLTVLSSSSSPTGTQSPGQQGTASPASGTSTPTTGATGTPEPGVPMLNISSQTLNFSTTQGQGNPTGQSETITNSGGSVLNWQASFNTAWLSFPHMNGSVAASQSGQLAVHVSANGLKAGTYSTEVTVSATDSAGAAVAGSPQFFTVTLTVLPPPCTLQVTPNSLTFSFSLLNPNPPDQQAILSESGNCARPVKWTASVDTKSSSWLSVKSSSGQDNGSGSSIEVHVNTLGVLVGKTGYITIYATGNGGATVQSSPQTVTVTLSFLQL
jgi:Viral BACON domain